MDQDGTEIPAREKALSAEQRRIVEEGSVKRQQQPMATMLGRMQAPCSARTGACVQVASLLPPRPPSPPFALGSCTCMPPTLTAAASNQQQHPRPHTPGAPSRCPAPTASIVPLRAVRVHAQQQEQQQQCVEVLDASTPSSSAVGSSSRRNVLQAAALSTLASASFASPALANKVLSSDWEQVGMGRLVRSWAAGGWLMKQQAPQTPYPLRARLHAGVPVLHVCVYVLPSTFTAAASLPTQHPRWTSQWTRALCCWTLPSPATSPTTVGGARAASEHSHTHAHPNPPDPFLVHPFC